MASLDRNPLSSPFLDNLEPPLSALSVSQHVRVRSISELGAIPIAPQDYPSYLAQYREGYPVEQRYREMLDRFQSGQLERVSSNDPKFSAVLDGDGEIVALRASHYLYCQAFEQALASGETLPSFSPAHLGAGVYCFMEVGGELHMVWHRKASSVHGAGLLHPILYGGYVEVSDASFGGKSPVIDLAQCLQVARVREGSEEIGSIDDIVQVTDRVVMINETATGNFPVQRIARVQPEASLEDLVSRLQQHNEFIASGKVVGAKVPEISQLVLVPFKVELLEGTQESGCMMRGVRDLALSPLDPTSCRIAPQGAQLICSQPLVESLIREALNVS